jgi:hypothetical protein
MEFERPNRGNWKKGHKLVGIGLMSKFNSSIICLCFRIVKSQLEIRLGENDYTGS